MSMPNIPDIKPVIDISREDALNMLLASIAMEEMGLAHIINAEGEKIQSILCRNVSTQEIIEVNQTVEKLIRETLKLQMLLHEKLETVVSLIPTPKPPVPPGPGPCPGPGPGPGPCPRPRCGPFCTLTGCGQGQVSNREDFFRCGTASVEAGECRNSRDYGSVPLKYTLCREKERNSVSGVFLTIPESVKTRCPRGLRPCPTAQEPNMLVMQGCGVLSVKRPGEVPVQCTASFTLTVWDDGRNKKFQMVICSPNSEFNHDSGIVLAKFGNLQIREICERNDFACPPGCED